MAFFSKRLVLASLVLGLLGSPVAWGDLHKNESAVATAAASTSEKVDINTADMAALETLPGVGPAKAKAVIEYREKMGAFESINDLEKVPGIGAKTLEGLKGKVTVKH